MLVDICGPHGAGGGDSEVLLPYKTETVLKGTVLRQVPLPSLYTHAHTHSLETISAFSFLLDAWKTERPCCILQGYHIIFDLLITEAR